MTRPLSKRVIGAAALCCLALSAAAQQVLESQPADAMKAVGDSLTMDLVGLIQNLGLPVGLLLAVLWWVRSLLDRHFSEQKTDKDALIQQLRMTEDFARSELRTIAVNSTLAINNNTSCLNSNTECIEELKNILLEKRHTEGRI